MHSHIFHQNYRNLYPINENIIERLVTIAEIPKPLLDIFVKYFPGDEEIFYEQYEQMYELRKTNADAIREQERLQRRGLQ